MSVTAAGSASASRSPTSAATARSTAVRRYGRPWNWLTFLTFSTAAVLVAYVRELRKGNQAAAVAKLKGVREGLKIDVRPDEALEARRAVVP